MRIALRTTAIVATVAAAAPAVTWATVPQITYGDPVSSVLPPLFSGPVTTPVLDGAVLRFGQPGDYLELDEVWIVSTDGGRTEGACRGSGNSVVFTPSSGFAGSALCQYTARVVRPGGLTRYPDFTSSNGPGSNYIAILPNPPTRRPTRPPTPNPTSKPTASPTPGPTDRLATPASSHDAPSHAAAHAPAHASADSGADAGTHRPPGAPRRVRRGLLGEDDDHQRRPGRGDAGPAPAELGRPRRHRVAGRAVEEALAGRYGGGTGTAPGEAEEHRRGEVRARVRRGYIGNTYVGPYECVFQAVDERGLEAEGTLILDVQDCTLPPGGRQAPDPAPEEEPVPAEFDLVTPEPTPGPRLGGGSHEPVSLSSADDAAVYLRREEGSLSGMEGEMLLETLSVPNRTDVVFEFGHRQDGRRVERAAWDVTLGIVPSADALLAKKMCGPNSASRGALETASSCSIDPWPPIRAGAPPFEVTIENPPDSPVRALLVPSKRDPATPLRGASGRALAAPPAPLLGVVVRIGRKAASRDRLVKLYKSPPDRRIQSGGWRLRRTAPLVLRTRSAASRLAAGAIASYKYTVSKDRRSSPGGLAEEERHAALMR
ncbi:hypothetical protein THAOC_37818, partial [Thalassiosira oceanica]